MISKKLLGTIIGKTIIDVKKDYSNLIVYTSYVEPRINDWKAVSIYELTYLCKEWAFKKGVEIVTYKRDYMTYRALPKGLKGVQTPEITMESEFEAVVESCKWILDQKLTRGSEQ